MTGTSAPPPSALAGRSSRAPGEPARPAARTAATGVRRLTLNDDRFTMSRSRSSISSSADAMPRVAPLVWLPGVVDPVDEGIEGRARPRRGDQPNSSRASVGSAAASIRRSPRSTASDAAACRRCRPAHPMHPLIHRDSARAFGGSGPDRRRRRTSTSRRSRRCRRATDDGDALWQPLHPLRCRRHLSPERTSAWRSPDPNALAVPQLSRGTAHNPRYVKLCTGNAGRPSIPRVPAKMSGDAAASRARLRKPGFREDDAGEPARRAISGSRCSARTPSRRRSAERSHVDSVERSKQLGGASVDALYALIDVQLDLGVSVVVDHAFHQDLADAVLPWSSAPRPSSCTAGRLRTS